MATATAAPGIKPTLGQFGAYEAAFDFFNEELFGGALPPCMLNFSRAANSAGFFAPNRWRRGEKRTHEISLNPDVLDMKLIEVMQTLVHEMCHLWQQEFGKPPRRCYHNKEWSAMMQAIGLMPSSTGKPGGARTGQHMQDYVIAGGRFHAAFMQMPDVCLLPWLSGKAGIAGDEKEDQEEKEKKRNKVKYTCPDCATNVWGKPGLMICCVGCEHSFEEQD